MLTFFKPDQTKLFQKNNIVKIVNIFKNIFGLKFCLEDSY